MLTLLVGYIHQHYLTDDDLQATPPQPRHTFLAQRTSRRASTHRSSSAMLEPRLLVEEIASNIQKISFGFLNHFVLFSCE